jgi:uncharacterized RDD family membrane protein YckC
MLVAGLAGGVPDEEECVNIEAASAGAGAGVMISSCVVALALALMVLVLLPAKSGSGSPEWFTVFIVIVANIRTVLESLSGQDVVM